MVPLSTVTSYKFPIVTIGLSLTVFTVLQLVTERQTDGTDLAKRQHYALKCISGQKCNKCNIFTHL